ncbi:MAG: DNA-3-methyladenine glycosylase [Rhodococcus sp.]|nr:DNA-3-methyladenine glycosylase [Rhodococcus sp. (in: high G+C Gram-positive bacteria)]
MTVDSLSKVDGPVSAARQVLGSVLRLPGVALRVVEVEAYGGEADGPWPDPASHSYRGRTPRNAVMFGRAGCLYVYRSYGMHFCMNVSYGPIGHSGGILLRAGEVIEGESIVRERRARTVPSHQLARGPGNFGSAAGVDLADNGVDLFDQSSSIRLELAERESGESDGIGRRWESGPRVGVSRAADRPWRLWIAGSESVSAYRRSPRATSTSIGMG